MTTLGLHSPGGLQARGETGLAFPRAVGIIIETFEGKETTMTAALTLDADGLLGTAGLSAGTALRQAATFLADVVKRGVSDPHAEFDDSEAADSWARRFYEGWVEDLSSEEYSALEEYKKEGFRSLNRFLREYDGDPSMFPPRERLRAEGLDAALQKAPILDRPVVVYRGRLPDAVLEAFDEGEEETLVDQVFGDLAYTSTSLPSGIPRE